MSPSLLDNGDPVLLTTRPCDLSLARSLELLHKGELDANLSLLRKLIIQAPNPESRGARTKRSCVCPVWQWELGTDS